MHPSERVLIGVHGAGGRMGQAIIRASAESTAPSVVVAAALVRPGSTIEGTPVPTPQRNGLPLDYSAALDPDAGVKVLVDFSHADSLAAAVALAVTHGLGLVSGTTGLDARHEALLEDASRRIPVLWAANFSLGVALLEHLSELAAAKLGPDFDAEILEIHHSRKRDAPSGTALALGRAVANGRGRYLEELARFQRHGQVGARQSGEIGFAVLRGGDSVGEHTVMFAGEGERIELTHRATRREVFAIGALRAARWLAERPAGRYRLADVFA